MDNECIREFMRKLALWYTKTFKPMMTHDELEPIMSTLGFVGQPPRPAPNGVVWKEYVYAGGKSAAAAAAATNERGEAAATAPPRPMLPYARIDGLHLCTYRAFIEAVNYYLQMDDISELFHIRGMALHKAYDRNKKFRRMEVDESIFVYREGTLDQATYNLYQPHNSGGGGGGDIDVSSYDNNNGNDVSSFLSYNNSVVIRSKGSSVNVGDLVPLKDIIV